MDRIDAPVALECPERVQHPPGRKRRNVVVPGNDEKGRAERSEVPRGGLVLLRPATVREVPAHDDEVGRDTLDELADSALEGRVVEAVPRAEMEVGHVEDAR